MRASTASCGGSRRPCALFLAAVAIGLILALGSVTDSRAAALPRHRVAAPARRRPAPPPRQRAAPPTIAVFPVPGARVAAPSTQITFRGIAPSRLGRISVSGSATGAHTGVIRGDSDGRGGSFVPRVPFKRGERVTVRTALHIVDARHGTFHFDVAIPAGPIQAAVHAAPKRVRGDVWRYASRGDLRPAAVRVTRQPSHTAPGDLFVASQQGPEQNGPELLGPHGRLIWFDPVPKGDSVTDFRTQSYEGKPVLTWWQGIVSVAGVGSGEDEILNTSYRPVATVRAGNGLTSDLHEFQLTGRSTALVTAYYPVYWNASSVKGGSKHQIVLDCVVQEIDIPTGLVLFQWDSLDHVPLSYSYTGPSKISGRPWDFFHINSIQRLSGDALLVSSRHTSAAYKVSLETGHVEWTLGGKHSSFRMGPGTTFAYQHDVRERVGDEITIFDDGDGPTKVEKQSRGLTLKLDYKHRTANLLLVDEHHPPLLAGYEGNVQRLPNHDDFVGWGQQPELTEFNDRGQVVFDAGFVGATDSYRAYRFPWQGTPTTRPAATTQVEDKRRTVYASWNGTTTTTRWRIRGGPTPATLKRVAAGRKSDFETGIRLPHAYQYVDAQALNGRGQVIATSPTTRG